MRKKRKKTIASWLLNIRESVETFSYGNELFNEGLHIKYQYIYIFYMNSGDIIANGITNSIITKEKFAKLYINSNNGHQLSTI